MYVDVHCHLTHKLFAPDLGEVIKKAQKASVASIIVNGLEPKSNRSILKMADKHKVINAALGIYPTEAVNSFLGKDFKFHVEKFNVDEEIDFIQEQAKSNKIIAVGECGLDGYHLSEPTFAEQERVFEKLLLIARSSNIPVIVHSRKLEKRVLEILAHHKLKKATLHCYMGKIKPAVLAAEKYGWCFSIPAILPKTESFIKLVEKLPPNCILTETDSPWLSLKAGTRNEPKSVIQTVKSIASIRSWQEDEAVETIWKNYQRLFNLESK